MQRVPAEEYLMNSRAITIGGTRFQPFAYSDMAWCDGEVAKVVVRDVCGIVRITTQGKRMAIGRSGDEKNRNAVTADFRNRTLTLTGDPFADWAEGANDEVQILLAVPAAQEIGITNTRMVQLDYFKGAITVDPTAQAGGHSSSKTCIQAGFIGKITGNVRDICCLSAGTASLNVAGMRDIGLVLHP
jgi:hypothetical protein